MNLMRIIPCGMTVILASCNGLAPADAVKTFIPGTYCASWQNPVSASRDSLFIVALSPNGSEGFIITRRTQLVFTNAGKKNTPQYRIVKWTGAYNVRDKTLIVSGNGRVLHFDPVAKTMQMGAIVYTKL
jgi:hypothetical protein